MNKPERPPLPRLFTREEVPNHLKGVEYVLDCFNRGRDSYVRKDELREYESAISLLDARVLNESVVLKRECRGDPDWLEWLVRMRYITPIDRRRRPWTFNEEQLRRDREQHYRGRLPCPSDAEIIAVLYGDHFTLQSLAEAAGVSKRYVALQLAAGAFPTITVGARVLIAPKDAEHWINHRNRKRGPRPHNLKGQR